MRAGLFRAGMGVSISTPEEGTKAKRDGGTEGRNDGRGFVPAVLRVDGAPGRASAHLGARVGFVLCDLNDSPNMGGGAAKMAAVGSF